MLGHAIVHRFYYNFGYNLLFQPSIIGEFTPTALGISGRFFVRLQLYRESQLAGVQSAVQSPTPPGLSDDAALRTVIDCEVGSTLVFRSVLHNKRYWFPVQQLLFDGNLWQTTQLQGSPVGTIIGSFTPPIADRRSYQNAFFLPQGFTYTPSANVKNWERPLSAYHQPLYFFCDINAAEIFRLRLRVYGDWPNSALTHPINDDPPPSGDASKRDAEVEYDVNAQLSNFGAGGPFPGRHYAVISLIRIGGYGDEIVGNLPNNNYTPPPEDPF
jgi:hypothetical protein